MAKKTTTAIAMFLMLTFAISLVALPAASAQTDQNTWYPYITASPNPVGVGQQVLAVFGFTMPTGGFGAPGIPSTYDGWVVTITDPDGKSQTIGPLNAETTGSSYVTFTPDKVGIWKLKAHYPGGVVNWTGAAFRFDIPPISVNVPAADTNEFSLTVQDEPLSYASGAPLPTSYWQFPIYGENREWNQIAGNWLMPAYDSARQFDCGGPAFNPYTTVPNTAHILWTKPQLFGGIVGGATDMTYYTGSAYRRELLPPVIINGRMYYAVQDPPAYGFYCVDLSNGETVWYQNGTYPDGEGGVVQGAASQITMGQVLTLDTPNNHGGHPYLWSTGATTWAVWNAWNGELLFTIKNAPVMGTSGFGASFYIDPEKGAILMPILDTFNNRILMWNSSKMFDAQVGLAFWQAAGPMYGVDWNAGVQLNASIPNIPGQSFVAFDPKDYSVIIASNQSQGTPLIGPWNFIDIAYSLKDGHVLWQKTRNEGTFESVVGGRAMSVADDCYVIVRKETRQVYAYSVSTGEEKWVGDAHPNQWGMYWTGQNFAYGKLFTISYDGEIWAHDAQTGKVLWKWGPVNSGLETPYSVYPLYGGTAIADHKIVVYNGEHSANSPLYRGERMYVVDTDNGTTVWSMNGWYQQPDLANGVVVAPNGYDGQIYCFGKGPSKTTVQAPLTQINMEETLTITGTVTDESPGAAGTAAIADEYMSPWMEYVYMQKQMPANATGVTVYIDVLDANNNYRNIGTATSDVSGFYSFVWKPDIPGKFTVVARFAGSEAYGSSYAEAAFNVVDAPAATAEPTPVPVSMADLYFVPSVIGIIVAIAVVGALILLMLRKRP